MKRLVALLALLTISIPAVAIEDDPVAYIGGTISNLRAGTTGRLDTSQTEAMAFEYRNGKLTIPFAKIDSYQYAQQRAHHWGVLATIAIALLKPLQTRHIFRISYHDENNTPHVALFEVPKGMPETLIAVLQTRAPLGCKPQAYFNCGRRN